MEMICGARLQPIVLNLCPAFRSRGRRSSAERPSQMFGRSRFLSLPMIIGAVVIGVVSGKAIFGPPLDEYWKKKLQEEAAAKEADSSSS